MECINETGAQNTSQKSGYPENQINRYNINKNSAQYFNIRILRPQAEQCGNTPAPINVGKTTGIKVVS